MVSVLLLSVISQNFKIPGFIPQTKHCIFDGTVIQITLFSLSNQISHFALIAQGIWCLASIGFILILGRLILGFEQVREDLRNPVIASAFASFFMAAFLFGSRLPLAQTGLSVTWIGLLGLYIAYIIFFSLRFMRPLSLNQVFPSWFVVYVGPAISLVTVPASVPTSIKGLILGVTGLATLALFPLVLWRMKQIAIPHLYQPILAILAAPLALLITSSIKSNQRPATIILLALLLFSRTPRSPEIRWNKFHSPSLLPSDGRNRGRAPSARSKVRLLAPVFK